jgi:hypothetical protein
MAVNEKASITVALQNGEIPYSLHHDLAGHFRMDRAVLTDRPDGFLSRGLFFVSYGWDGFLSLLHYQCSFHISMA